MTDDFTGWRKSIWSKTDNCVEVGTGPAVIVVRDSKFADSPVLAFGADAWARFTASLRADDAA